MASEPPNVPGGVDARAGRVDEAPPAVLFRLLGPFEIQQAGKPVRISGSRQRTVLAVLLLDAGKVMSTERLIRAVWDDDPPSTARTQIQISISKLRGSLAGIGLPDVIVTHESGYLIQVPDDAIDIARFHQLATAGRDAARRQDTATATSTLREALGMWRGEALVGMRSPLLQSVAVRLDEERLAVAEEFIDLLLDTGRHHEVISDLRKLIAGAPLRESFYRQLMLALSRDGRQAEALEVYRDARRVFVEEHGIDPSEELRALERAILEADSTVVTRPAAEPDRPVPLQLPARTKDFVGRADSGRQVQEAIARGSHVLVVTGPAGVGKTAFAVAVAHDLSEQFPDGQLFAHLRRGAGQPVQTEQVLDYLLRALGVPPSMMPSDRDALASLYRSRVANRRLLVLLDSADSVSQVEPLLPGGSGVVVIVTSRGSLPGLPNASRISLESFTPEASKLLLSQVVGSARVDAEPEAAEAVAVSCGHLPLALQITAAKLSARHHWQIARMANRLSDESRRLDELSLDGAGVRSSLAVSVEALDPTARRLLLLLGTLGTADFASWVAGPLLDRDMYDAADVLDELIDARLVEVSSGAGAKARYLLHDLVGVFARELLVAEVPPDDRIAAQQRLLRCWRFLTYQAHRREYGGDFTVLLSNVPDWPLPTEMVDELLADPIRWFESEHVNVVHAVMLAAELDQHDLCCDLAVTSVTFFEARAHREDWRETHEVALRVAVRHADRRAEAAVRCSRAGLALVEQRFADAQSDLNAALAWFSEVDNAHGRGLVQRSLGSIDRLQGRHAQARERYEEALAQLRDHGDQVGEAHVLINLAQLASADGDHPQSEELLNRSLEICTRVGSRRVAAQARCRLGDLHLEQGDLDRAETAFDAALTAVISTEDPLGEAYALLGAGTVQLERNDHERARDMLTTALHKVRQSGSPVGEGRVLLALTELHLRVGELAEAAGRLHEADTTFAEIGAQVWQERAQAVRESLRARSE